MDERIESFREELLGLCRQRGLIVTIAGWDELTIQPHSEVLEKDLKNATFFDWKKADEECEKMAQQERVEEAQRLQRIVPALVKIFREHQIMLETPFDHDRVVAGVYLEENLPNALSSRPESRDLGLSPEEFHTKVEPFVQELAWIFRRTNVLLWASNKVNLRPMRMTWMRDNRLPTWLEECLNPSEAQ